MRRMLIVPALVLAAATIAAPAFASNDDSGAMKPQSNWMTIEQLTQKLTGEGYKVRQIKVERKGYEVYAIDKEGRRLEAYIDPVTGALLESESGEDD